MTKPPRIGPDPLDNPSELTAPWLEAALRAAGFEVAISAVSVEPIGTGQMSVSVRASAKGTSVGAQTPRSVVVKMPTPDRAMRAIVSPGYKAEIAFYREVAPKVCVDVPRCYLALANEDASSFTLVLEDMAPATQGDQVAGASPSQVAAAARNLAGLHGPRWCDGQWWESSWLPPVGPKADTYLAGLVAGALPQLAARLGPSLSGKDKGTLEDAAGVMAAFLGARSKRFGPIHGDYRLDNLLFGQSGRVTAVDWQTLSVGLPARDLAYLLGTSLEPSERRAVEADVVRAYWEDLMAGGVTAYGHTDCFEDYRIGMLQCPLTIVLGAAYGTRTSRGDLMFSTMIRRSCQALRDLGTIELAAAEAA